jgi:hypothetical protein
MGRARDSESAFEEAYWTVLAGRMGSEEGVSQVPNDQRDLFAAMTKVLVEAVREETRETFKLMREYEDDSDVGVSSSELVRLTASLTEGKDREIPIETSKEETKQASPSMLDGASLRSLIKETAVESVSRRVDHALGRIPR